MRVSASSEPVSDVMKLSGVVVGDVTRASAAGRGAIALPRARTLDP